MVASEEEWRPLSPASHSKWADALKIVPFIEQNYQGNK